jgi:prolyl oligopeptidase
MSQTQTEQDPYLWLEDVQGDTALAWVRERNAQTEKRLLQAQPGFAATRTPSARCWIRASRSPTVSRRGDWFYNFWRDADHPRGLWRRTTLAEYRKAKPAWETVIDIDALGKAEKENWVWAGADCLGPDYRRCLVSLSRGGADAKVVREFDTVTSALWKVASLPEAKSDVDWLDADTLYVGTDFGPGSLTDSGYPRIVKRWQRGQPLAEATTVFEAERQDVSVPCRWTTRRALSARWWAARSTSTATSSSCCKGRQAGAHRQTRGRQADVLARTPAAGTAQRLGRGRQDLAARRLLVADAAAYLKGGREFTALFTPTATRSLEGYTPRAAAWC